MITELQLGKESGRDRAEGTVKGWQIHEGGTEKDYWSSTERLRRKEETTSLKGHKCTPVTSDPREQEVEANGEQKDE